MSTKAKAREKGNGDLNWEKGQAIHRIQYHMMMAMKAMNKEENRVEKGASIVDSLDTSPRTVLFQ